MHPKRRLLINLGLPLYVLISVGGFMGLVLLDVFVVSADHEPTWLSIVGIVWFFFISAMMLVVSAQITKIEARAEVEKYAYLFQDAALLDGEKVTLHLAEEGIVFTLTKDGLSVTFEEKCEGQVFDEMPENVRFIAWEYADCFLFTRNTNRRVEIGLAVIDPNVSIERQDIFVVPINEEVYSAMHAFGLMEKTAYDWVYLRYNPEDAFKQIINTGRVLKLRDKKTGKILKNEEEIFRA